MKVTKILTVEKDGDWVVANTPEKDRDGDRIFPDKINVTNFRKNPALFWGHNYREPWALIGEVAEWESDEKSFRYKPELREPANEADPMHIIRSLWDDGYLRASSIGFIPNFDDMQKNDEGGYDFGEVELLEISLVPLPAHQDALRMAIKAFNDEEPKDENTGEEDPPVIDEPAPEPTEQEEPQPESSEEPTTDQPPHDESDPELDAIADDLLEIAYDFLEVLQ